MEQTGETWKFEVQDRLAERVYLVKDCDGGFSTWIEMRVASPGTWEVTTRLNPGRYRFRYFSGEGTAFFNGGTHGLKARRISDEDTSVVVEPMPYAQPA